MGILDKIFRRRKEKSVYMEEKYILKRQTEQGGMIKVMELARPATIDELYPHLEPGIYALDVYRKGQTGFQRLWGPVEVLGEEKPARRRARREEGGSAISEFVSMARYLTEMKEKAKEEFAVLKEFFEPKQITTADIVNVLKNAEEQYKELAKIFGRTTTKSQEIPITGSIPAIAVYIPEMINKSLDAIEQRMVKWGFIESGRRGVLPSAGQELIRLPPKPKVVTKPKPEEEIKTEKVGEESEPKAESEKGTD